MESAMPGTTLQIIPLQAFESGGVLYGESSHFSRPAQFCECVPTLADVHALRVEYMLPSEGRACQSEGMTSA